MKTLIAIIGFMSLGAVARADSAPPPPPEMKKTVEAFLGNWMFDATVTMPGSTPQKAKLKMDCKKTALGKAVVCSGDATIPGVGASQATFLVGYDTWTKSVHFMGITSDEEVHDHKCQWKSETTLACEPHKGGMGGQPATEELGFVAAPGALGFKSTTILKDGNRIVFEANAKKK